MAANTLLKASRILRFTASYFFLCGVSAIFYPASWLFLSGLPIEISPTLAMVFSVLGGYLVAVGFGAAIAAGDPERNRGIVLMLTVANLLDLCVTLKGILLQELPLAPGMMFLAVTIFLSLLLGTTYRSLRRNS
jgi:hypothetical protein